MDSVTPNQLDGQEAVEAQARANTTSTVNGEDEVRWKRWLAAIERCITYKRELIPEWSTNIDYRRAKMFESDSDLDRVPITTDWSMTKAKQAQLFSAVPEVRLTPVYQDMAPPVAMFQRKLNAELCKGRVNVAMDEMLPDVINASGVGAVLVAHESRTVMKRVAVDPPEVVAAKQQLGIEIQMRDVPQVVASRLRFSRRSPADLLWPTEFEGSDFDDADWRGHTGRVTWEIAKSMFGDKLPDEAKKRVVGRDIRTSEDSLTYSDDKELAKARHVVTYHELFYWRYVYHQEETSYEAIQRLVFVDGLDEPVIDEEWNGQRRDPEDPGAMLGPQKPPLRFLTLTYISDEAIPPSDSAMGRPQVDELIRARSQVIRQRESSMPMRWMNVNRIDPLVQNTLMRGTWQGVIPLNGDGSNAIGEVARAVYPAEDFRFNDIARSELYDTWQVSPNQMGGSGVNQIRSASEANIIQQNFQTRIGYERARVTANFVSIAEVAAGLLSLHGRFDQRELEQLGQFPRERLSTYYAYNVRADSTVLLDATQRYERLERFLNMSAKSGYVSVKPILTEMAILAGLNVAEVMIDPPQPKPDGANVSLRGDVETALKDPIVLAYMETTGQAPSMEQIEKAKGMILAANGPAAPPAPPAPPSQQPAPPTEDVMPDYNEVSRVNKRQEDGQ